MLLDLIGISFKRLKNRMVESVVVILSLAFGLAVVSTIISVIFAFGDSLNDVQDNPWRRVINVYPAEFEGADYGETIKKIGNKNLIEGVEFSLEDIERVKESCPSIDYAYIEDWMSLYDQEVEDENENWWETSPAAFGVNNDWFLFNKKELEGGTFFSTEDYINGNNVVVLGNNIKNLLFAQENPIGKDILFGDKSFKVIGYLKADYGDSKESDIEERKANKWDDNNYVILPYSYKTMKDGTTKISYFSLGIDDYNNLEKAVEEVKYYLNSEFPGNGLMIKSSLDWNDDFDNTSKIILRIVGFIAATALLIATLTNLNLMLARVTREKKGFGISQALGASKAIVFINTLLDSVVVGFVGAFLGLLLMVLFTIGADVILGSAGSVVSATLSVKTFVINIILSIFITSLFSFFPALKATQVAPSQVLRED
ncbi:MAG: ABC transporter permease [Spirochaetales bacterium]|nr:ABC transporter permease [Spirochaetales bacterium]